MNKLERLSIKKVNLYPDEQKGDYFRYDYI